jgi:hypothetical protein
MVEGVLVVVLDVRQAVDEGLVLDDVVVDRLHEPPRRVDLDAFALLVPGEGLLEVDDAEEEHPGRAPVEVRRGLERGGLFEGDVRPMSAASMSAWSRA